MQTWLKSENGTLLQRAIILNISLSTNLWKNIVYVLPGNGADYQQYFTAVWIFIPGMFYMRGKKTPYLHSSPEVCVRSLCMGMFRKQDNQVNLIQ
jgi:hypothetical protein